MHCHIFIDKNDYILLVMRCTTWMWSLDRYALINICSIIGMWNQDFLKMQTDMHRTREDGISLLTPWPDIASINCLPFNIVLIETVQISVSILRIALKPFFYICFNISICCSRRVSPCESNFLCVHIFLLHI
jgi:hypothetical protein